MTNATRPPTDLPSPDQDGYIHIDDSAASQLIEAGLAFDADDNVVLHAEHTTLKTSLEDLQKLGVDSVNAKPDETDGEHDVVVSLGLDLTGDNATSELESLLNSFDTDEPLFAEDDNITLDIGDFDANSLDASIIEELRLLGIDDIIGEDDEGNPDTRHLDDI